jgi:hypothetical protein
VGLFMQVRRLWHSPSLEDTISGYLAEMCGTYTIGARINVRVFRLLFRKSLVECILRRTLRCDSWSWCVVETGADSDTCADVTAKISRLPFHRSLGFESRDVSPILPHIHHRAQVLLPPPDGKIHHREKHHDPIHHDAPIHVLGLRVWTLRKERQDKCRHQE